MSALGHAPAFVLRWLARLTSVERVNKHLPGTRSVKVYGMARRTVVDPDDRIDE